MKLKEEIQEYLIDEVIFVITKNDSVPRKSYSLVQGERGNWSKITRSSLLMIYKESVYIYQERE